MYRFSTEDRNYIKWTAYDTTSEVKLAAVIQPIESKLFNFDVFNYSDGKVEICNSPTRCGSIAGVLVLEHNKTYGKYKSKFLYKCIPDDRRLPIFLVPYRIKPNFNKAYKNKYVIIYFRHWDNKHPSGYIDQNLGEINNLSSFYQYQLYCRSLNASIQNFTKNARKELKKRPEDELVAEIIYRYSVADRRDRDIITIDPLGSKDFDDAIGMLQNDNGCIVSIYIANVPLWLDFLGLWKSFSNRIATIYLPDRRLPMLPAILSDVLCSLQENCSRFALALDIHINEDHTVGRFELVNTVIRVSKNLRYDTKEMSENRMYKNVYKIVEELHKKRPYIDTIKSCHDIIAYLMIMMNHYCAGLMFCKKIGIYRSMTYGETAPPETVKDSNVRNFLKGWHSTGGSYSKIQNMQMHDALNLDKYIHITSPIRRLVDLLNIIQIQSRLRITNFTANANEFYGKWTTDENIKFINETMRSIRKVQNECSLLYMCVNTPSILSKTQRGFVFDKMKRADGMFQYQVYLQDLKMVRKTLSPIEIGINDYYNFILYLFMDQERLYQKVRITLKIDSS